MKVLIADDHELFRDGLKLLVEQMYPIADVVMAANFNQAIKKVNQDATFEIVLLDLIMPGISWDEGIKLVKANVGPQVPVVVVSAYSDYQFIRLALRAGASGYIPKTTSIREMAEAIHHVLAGSIYLPLHMLEEDMIKDQSFGIHESKAALTPRQREVLCLLSEGLSNREIAKHLQLAEITIKMHVSGILRALNVTTRTQAAILSAQQEYNDN